MFSNTKRMLQGGEDICILFSGGKNIKFIFFFSRGHGNESRNLIGSLPGQYFPISAQGPRHFRPLTRL